MTNIWAEISEIGDLFKLLAVAPFLFGMGVLAIRAGLYGSNPTMLKESVELMVNGILALVPLSLGGILLAMFFKYAEERA